MPLRRISLAAFSCLAILSVAGAFQAQPPRDPAVPMGMQGDHPPIRVLSENEVSRYIDTLRALVAAGIDAEKNLGTDPSQLKASSAIQKYSSEMMGVLESHGLDQQSFSDIHWNMISAWAALEINKNKKKVDESRAQQEATMAAMKSHMSPQQYQAMMQGMQEMNAYENVPEENLKLARKHREVLDEISQSTKKQRKK